jgi:hypothetical protein
MVFPSLCSLIFDIVLSRNKEVVGYAGPGIYDLGSTIYDRADEIGGLCGLVMTFGKVMSGGHFLK